MSVPVEQLEKLVAELPRHIGANFSRIDLNKIDFPSLLTHIRQVEAERDHWKANHDKQVKIKRRLHGLYRSSLEANKELIQVLMESEDCKQKDGHHD